MCFVKRHGTGCSAIQCAVNRERTPGLVEAECILHILEYLHAVQCAVNRQRTPLVAANSASSPQGACIRICQRILLTPKTQEGTQEWTPERTAAHKQLVRQCQCNSMPVHKLAAASVPASERARQVDVTPTTSSVPKGQIGVTPTIKLVSLPIFLRAKLVSPHNYIICAQRPNWCHFHYIRGQLSHHC